MNTVRFERSTHEFWVRVWMRHTGGRVPFDQWKRDYDRRARRDRRRIKL